MTPGDRPTVFVTGATDGLGLAVTHRLAADGAALVLHGRDRDRLDRVADEIRDTHHVDRPRTVCADLAELAQVRRLATDVRATVDRLDVFVSNAGIGAGFPDLRVRQTSVDGYELRFAVNYLAGFLLSLELLPLLRASAPARIVNVASVSQHPLDFADLMLDREYSGVRAYRQSKLAQVMSGFELASRMPAGEVTVNSVHPATRMPTKIVLAEKDGRFVDSLEVGVASTYRLIADPALVTATGLFFDRRHAARADAQAYDPGARAELWRSSLNLVVQRTVNAQEAPTCMQS